MWERENTSGTGWLIMDKIPYISSQNTRYKYCVFFIHCIVQSDTVSVHFSPSFEYQYWSLSCSPCESVSVEAVPHEQVASSTHQCESAERISPSFSLLLCSEIAVWSQMDRCLWLSRLFYHWCFYICPAQLVRLDINRFSSSTIHTVVNLIIDRC